MVDVGWELVCRICLYISITDFIVTSFYLPNDRILTALYENSNSPIRRTRVELEEAKGVLTLTTPLLHAHIVIKPLHAATTLALQRHHDKLLLIVLA